MQWLDFGGVCRRDKGSGHMVRPHAECPKSSVVDLGFQERSGVLLHKFQINGILIEIHIKDMSKKEGHAHQPNLSL